MPLALFSTGHLCQHSLSYLNDILAAALTHQARIRRLSVVSNWILVDERWGLLDRPFDNLPTGVDLHLDALFKPGLLCTHLVHELWTPRWTAPLACWSYAGRVLGHRFCGPPFDYLAMHLHQRWPAVTLHDDVRVTEHHDVVEDALNCSLIRRTFLLPLICPSK